MTTPVLPQTGIVTWVTKPGRPRISTTSRADLARSTQDLLTRSHAADVVACYIDPTQLRALAVANQGGLAETFRALLPTKAHIRSGDFGEMLMWRLLQDRDSELRVPLYRWRMRQSRDDTVRGVDLVGYKSSGVEPSTDDILIICEVKTRAVTRKKTIVREAYDGARKGYVSRLADQLLFQQFNLRQQGAMEDAAQMARFANPHKFGEYRTRLVAAVVHERTLWTDSYLNYLPNQHRLHADVEVLIVCVEELRRWMRRVRNAAIRQAASL